MWSEFEFVISFIIVLKDQRIISSSIFTLKKDFSKVFIRQTINYFQWIYLGLKSHHSEWIDNSYVCINSDYSTLKVGWI